MSYPSLFAELDDYIPHNRNAERLLHYAGKCITLKPSGEGIIPHTFANRSLKPLGWRARYSRQTFLWSPLRFEGGSAVFRHSDVYWLAYLQQCNDDAGSDFSFALRRANKTPEEQAQQLIELRIGDWNEFHCVAQWILALEGHDYCQSDSTMQGEIFLHIRYCAGNISLFIESDQNQFVSRHSLLWNQWLRFFNLTLDYANVELYTATSHAVSEGFGWEYFRLSAALTQHEHLETLMSLRDWLRNRVSLSNECIAELLA